MVAALGNLQVRVMSRGQFDTLRRHQIHERIVRPREMGVDRRHDVLAGVRSGHRQHARMQVAHYVALRTQTAGHDHPAVFGQRLADDLQRFRHRRVDKTTGIHHHQIRRLIRGYQIVTLGSQTSQDLFGIHQRLGATEADKPDLGRTAHGIMHAGGLEMERWRRATGRKPGNLKRCALASQAGK